MKHYKKRIVLWLVSALMLTGCRVQPEPDTEASGSNSEIEQKTEEKTETTTEQQNAQEANGMVRMRVEHHYYDNPVDPGNGTSFSGEYDTLQVTDMKPESAIMQAVTAWADGYEKRFMTQAAEYAQEASEDTYSQENGTFYYLNNTIKTERVDSQVISLSLDNASYRGGVHGDYWTNGVTFDVVAGKQLALADLGDIQTELKDYVWERLEPQSDEFFEDSEQAIEDLIQSGDICWYLTGQGIQIVFNPYEIAPYGAGQQRVLVPYGELTGMKSDYIPDQNTEGIDCGTLAEDTVYEQDMDGDGNQDTLSIKVDCQDQDNMNAVTICYNTAELTLTETLGMTSAYICKDKDKYYLLLTTYGHDEYYTTRLYEFPEGEPIEVFHLDGGCVQGCSQDGVWIEEEADQQSTSRYYTLQDGTLKPIQVQ